MRLPVAVFACALLACAGNARADWGVTFVRPTCVGSIRYFSIDTIDITNVDELFLVSGEELKRVAEVVVKEANLHLDSLPISLSCKFHDGTEIEVESTPNEASERHQFPGSAIKLTIDGHIVLENVGFGTDCTWTAIGLSIYPDQPDHVRVHMGRSTVYGPVDESDPLSRMPSDLTLSFDSSYDTTKDPMRIRNCYSRDGQHGVAAGRDG